jgi:hypothetical protein
MKPIEAGGKGLLSVSADFWLGLTDKMEAYLSPKHQALPKLGYVNIIILKSFAHMYTAVIGAGIQFVLTTGTLMENINIVY